MKYIQALFSAVACAAVMAFTSTASAQDVKQGVVTVVRIHGEARYSAGDNVWHPVMPGTTLSDNDVIQSGANSTVDLVLAEKVARVGYQSTAGSPIGGSVTIAGLPVTPINAGQSTPEQNIIRLQPDTTLAIDKFTFTQTGADTVSDTELDLRSGNVFGNVKKISAESKYLIKMPTGVAGVRGTAFLLGANGDVTVLSGSVVVSGIGANGQVYTTVVAAGDQFNPQTGQVTRLTPRSLVAAIRDATAIVIAIHETVTVVETPTINGYTPIIEVSPTSGHSGTFVGNL